MKQANSESKFFYGTSTEAAYRKIYREKLEEQHRNPTKWVVCPTCGYERPVGQGCGLPCV